MRCRTKGMELNGVVLISSILNYAVRASGIRHETSSICRVRGDCVVSRQAGAEAGGFEGIPQGGARATRAGRMRRRWRRATRLPEAEEMPSRRSSAPIQGLSVEYLKQTNLRINPARFRKELTAGRARDHGPLRCALRRHGRGCGRRDAGDTIRRTRQSPAHSSPRFTTTWRTI